MSEAHTAEKRGRSDEDEPQQQEGDGKRLREDQSLQGEVPAAQESVVSISGTFSSPPEAGSSASSSPGKPGDWACPKCQHHNYSFRNACQKCNATKSGEPIPAGKKPGDWTCDTCHHVNYPFRAACQKCNKPKPYQHHAPFYSSTPAPVLKNPNDWICPNPSCQDIVYASRASCRKCNTPRPPHWGQSPAANTWSTGYSSYGAPPLMSPVDRSAPYGGSNYGYTPAPQNAGPGSYGGSSGYGVPSSSTSPFGNSPASYGNPNTPAPAPYGNPPSSAPSSYATSSPASYVTPSNSVPSSYGSPSTPSSVTSSYDQSYFAGVPPTNSNPNYGYGAPAAYGAPPPRTGGNPNDWTCPNCHDHVYASRSSCRKCNTPKPVGGSTSDANAQPAPSAGNASRGVDARGLPVLFGGDWRCPNCLDHVYRSRAACRKCGQAKPSDLP
jgi:hypothetical protein